MALLTDIAAENNLRQEPFRDQKRYVAHADFIGRVTVAYIADIINANEYTFSSDSQQLLGIVTVTKMADRDSVGRDIFFPQQRDLFHRKLAEMRGVRHYACAGPPLRPRRCTKYAFLSRRNVFALCPDLANDAGPDTGTVGAVIDLADNQIRKFICIALINERRIYALAVPSGAHDDPDTCSFRDTAQRSRIAPQSAACGIYQAAAAGLAVFGKLANRQAFIVENAVIASRQIPQVD